MRLKRYEEAYDILQWTRLEWEDGDVLGRMAKCLLFLNRAKEVIEIAELALDHNPEMEWINAPLILALTHPGHIEEINDLCFRNISTVLPGGLPFKRLLNNIVADLCGAGRSGEYYYDLSMACGGGF